MGWIKSKRKNIIENYRVNLIVSTLSDISSIQAKLFQSKKGYFDISTNTHCQNVIISFPSQYEESVQIEPPPVYTEPLSVELKSPRIMPQFEDIVKIHTVSLNDFKLTIQRFDFQPDRREPESLFPTRTKRTPLAIGRKIVKIEPPQRPLTLDKRSIEERLKWILMPPIHEVLSDPQLALPEKPYSFQTFGIKWLYDRDSALLADEMGLGKTMQAIIAARLLWKQEIIKQILIVCPKTLISNWKAEFGKWWPQVIHNIIIADADTDRRFFLKLGTPNVIVKIINYDSLLHELEWLKSQKFSHDLIIIDEAQRIKTPGSKTAQAVKALKSPRRWALTGTPLENKIEDLFSIFDFVSPGLFHDDKGNPAPEYCRTFLIEDNDNYDIKDMIRPYILRRRADEVDIGLPEKFEQDIEIDLDPEHYSVYKQMEDEGVVELNEKGDSITVTHVFALIIKLRQICNFCPVNKVSAKLEQLLEDIEEISKSNRKALIFSQFVSEDFGVKRIAKELDDKGFNGLQLHGEIPQRKRDVVKEEFDTNENLSYMTLNFKVGGLGLNLQAANYVYLFDRWWNPAVEDQAVKRTHRIGQTRTVFVRKFYCKDTIEERILKKLAEKRRLFRQVIDENRPAESMGLTEEEIFSLFNLKVRPRKQTQQKEEGKSIQLILDNISPSQFENVVAAIYEKQGYKVTVTGGSHDRGIDIIAEKSVGEAREKVIIQCKHQEAVVGRPVLQQLWGVVADDHSITRGDLVTSSSFSAEAKDFAKGKRLTLIKRKELIRLAREFKVATFE
jgi:SNF2 family DNA or RNA helicase